MLMFGTVLSLSAAPKRELVTKSFNLSGFDKVSQNWLVDVEITQAGTTSVQFTGEKKVLDALSLSVSSDGTLVIKCNQQNWHQQGEAKALLKITMPSLTNVAVKGSGDIDIKGKFSSDNLSVLIQGSGDVDIESFAGKKFNASILGAGDIEMTGTVSDVTVDIKGAGDCEIKNVNLNNLTVNIMGAGDVDLSGTAVNAVYTVKGAGDIDAGSMKAQNVKASVFGSGDITCYASKSFVSTKKGTGDIHCKGNAAIRK